MEKRDWLLLALAAAKTKGLTPVQIQKSLFLFGENMSGIGGSRFYKFVPYNYGPFDKRIYSDAEALETEGLVVIEKESASFSTGCRRTSHKMRSPWLDLTAVPCMNMKTPVWVSIGIGARAFSTMDVTR